jgi:uncharacterized protein (TIGR03086 family)
MSDQIDLTPAANELVRLLSGVTDDQFTAPTPCEEFTLADLVLHIDNFTSAFTAAAAKDLGPATNGSPNSAPTELAPDWRTTIPAKVRAMAEAWSKPDAWEGTTQAGGVDLPAAVMGRFALDELVVHAWDLARASRQPFICDQQLLDVVEALVTPQPNGDPSGPFGPPVLVPADAPQLDRVIGYTGRDPHWTAA